MYILSILYKRIYSYFLMPCYHYFENKNWCKIYIKVVWRGHLAEGEIVCSCVFSIIREKVASSTLCSLLFSTATLSALSLAFKVHAPTPEVVCFIPSCVCVCVGAMIWSESFGVDVLMNGAASQWYTYLIFLFVHITKCLWLPSSSFFICLLIYFN